MVSPLRSGRGLSSVLERHRELHGAPCPEKKTLAPPVRRSDAGKVQSADDRICAIAIGGAPTRVHEFWGVPSASVMVNVSPPRS